MEYFVYILESEIAGRLYIGQTIELNKRIKEHNF
ncbi:GIY-YIG nuclease family protein [Flavobacterium frigoris]|nr:GIY-YIG nuclease family protein [Flavobacterium frigoris]